MSVHQGSFSISRYRVVGRKKNLSIAELNKNLPKHRLMPFSLNKTPTELSFGWDAPWGDLETKGKHWDMSDCQVDDGFWLRVRTEKRTVSHQLLQLVVSGEEQKILAASDTETISRKKRKELLEDSRRELLKQTLPTIRYFEAFWKDKEDTIFLFSTSKANRSIFEELFRKTFGSVHELSIVLMTPPLLGIDEKVWSSKEFDQSDEAFLNRIEAVLPAGLTSESAV